MRKDKYTKEKCLKVVARDSRGGFGHIIHGVSPVKTKVIKQKEFTDNEKLERIAKFETLMRSLRYKVTQDYELSVRGLFGDVALYKKAHAIEQQLRVYVAKKTPYTNLSSVKVSQIEEILKKFGVKF